MPQREVQARQVLLSWEPGSDGLSPVRYYTVQLRELPESNWSVHSASVSHGATSYPVSRLLFITRATPSSHRLALLIHVGLL